jgi:hypothetical protein
MAGMVLDQSGLAIAGANVTATHMETGIIRTAATDSSGNCRFTMLTPGNYRVRFSAIRYWRAKISRIRKLIAHV